MKNLTVKLISLYRQAGLSSLGYVFFGPSFGCRFYPTCACYTERSIRKYGLIRGAYKGLTRVIKCNQFNKGGIDLP